MLPQAELTAYQTAVNLPLLSNIVAFVLETAESPHAQRPALYRCYPLLCEAKADAFQKRYGFLYLGELLERYEERFGMTDADLRAIALALAYTRDVATDAMFVGNQKADFLRRLRRSASGDIYLTGALYLISDGQDAGIEAELIKSCNRTEKLLFALSLFGNHEHAFTIFKPQLLSLLGSNRTMPVIAAANDTDLVDLVSYLGYHVRPIGRYHTTNEMTTSLRIKNRRIWYRYSESVGGDAIALMRHFMGQAFTEAVKFLLAWNGRGHDPPDPTPIRRTKPPPPQERPVFVLPPRNGSSERVYTCLRGRGIGSGIIASFIDSDMRQKPASRRP